MIPKRIHYCWFGKGPKGRLEKNCIKSWKQFLPDYEIMEWNENNFDIKKAPRYVQEAYQQKKWAFVTDYVRLAVIYEQGGLYFDTDVEVLASFDPFLKYSAFFGFQNHKEVEIGRVHTEICTGEGFGAIPHLEIISDLMKDYEDIPFILENGEMDLTPCPERNLHVFQEYGLELNNQRQILSDNILILESEVLCPIDYATSKMNRTDQTMSIHWYNASWHDTNKWIRKIIKFVFGQNGFMWIRNKYRTIINK